MTNDLDRCCVGTGEAGGRCSSLERHHGGGRIAGVECLISQAAGANSFPGRTRVTCPFGGAGTRMGPGCEIPAARYLAYANTLTSVPLMTTRFESGPISMSEPSSIVT